MSSKKQAIIEALNQSFPTIITSGTILAAAGILIGFLSSEEAISSIGICLGRGTIISIILVMSVLPQLLLLGDFIIEKTAFTISLADRTRLQKGNLEIDGHIKGYVTGVMEGEFKGILQGTMSAGIGISSEQKEKEAAEDEEKK